MVDDKVVGLVVNERKRSEGGWWLAMVDDEVMAGGGGRSESGMREMSSGVRFLKRKIRILILFYMN